MRPSLPDDEGRQGVPKALAPFDHPPNATFRARHRFRSESDPGQTDPCRLHLVPGDIVSISFLKQCSLQYLANACNDVRVAVSASLHQTNIEWEFILDGSESGNRRAEIAARSRQRAIDERIRKLSTAVAGLLAYSGFSNIWSGSLALMQSPVVALLVLGIGLLYAHGAYRVWMRNDLRWWPVLVPTCIVLAMESYAWLGGYRWPLPLLINSAILVLFLLLKRTVAGNR
jgi:hypothetical protein